jgi:hypothetical protein
MISILSFILGISLINTHVPVAVIQPGSYNNKQNIAQTAKPQLDYTYYYNVSRPEIKKQQDAIEAERLAQQKLLLAQQQAEAARQQEVLNYQASLARRKAIAKQNPQPAVTAVSGDFQEAIRVACANYGCNPTQLIRVMYCESGGRSNAFNRVGSYIGLFQFSTSTFNANAKRVGIPNPNVWDPYQQINVAAYMFSIGQSRQWTCK